MAAGFGVWSVVASRRDSGEVVTPSAQVQTGYFVPSWVPEGLSVQRGPDDTRPASPEVQSDMLVFRSENALISVTGKQRSAESSGGSSLQDAVRVDSSASRIEWNAGTGVFSAEMLGPLDRKLLESVAVSARMTAAGEVVADSPPGFREVFHGDGGLLLPTERRTVVLSPVADDSTSGQVVIVYSASRLTSLFGDLWESHKTGTKAIVSGHEATVSGPPGELKVSWFDGAHSFLMLGTSDAKTLLRVANSLKEITADDWKAIPVFVDPDEDSDEDSDEESDESTSGS